MGMTSSRHPAEMRSGARAGARAVALLGALTIGAAGAAAGTALEEPALGVGDEAPSLEEVEWIKGRPFKRFRRGEIYVLDFWATWCGPCLAEIPHMSRLAREYDGQRVNVVGVAIWPRSRMTPTAEFVAEREAELDYAICRDVNGAVARAYMEAAGRNSIPTTMIVGRRGTIEWIGHPVSGLDEALAAIVEGTFDAAATDRVMREREARAAEIVPELDKSRRYKLWRQVVAQIDELLALDEKLYGGYGALKYQALVRSGQRDAARAWGRELYEGRYHDEAGGLNELAWWIVDPDTDIGPADRDLELALLAATRAHELSEEPSPSVLDTLARVRFRRGEHAEAIALQEQAVELAEGKLRKQLESTLDEYRLKQREAELAATDGAAAPGAPGAVPVPVGGEASDAGSGEAAGEASEGEASGEDAGGSG